MTAPVSSVSSEHSRALLNQHAENRNIIQELIRGHEIDMLKLLDLLERLGQKLSDGELKIASLSEQVISLESELNMTRNEVMNANEQLRHARAQMVSLMSEKDELKIECSEMERKLQLVKELVKPDISRLNDEEQQKLAFLNDLSSAYKVPTAPVRFAPARKTDASMDDGIDYDKTDENLEQISCADADEVSFLRNGKVFRRSRSGPSQFSGSSKRPKSGSHHLEVLDEEAEVPSKRSKGSPYTNTNTLITTTTTVTVDPIGNTPPKAKVTIRRSFNRSISESNLLVLEKEQRAAESAKKFNALTPKCGATSIVDLRSPLVPARNWIKGGTIDERGHTYSNYSSIIGDKCDVCARWIGLGGKPAMKCNDCNLHLHKCCANRAPIPCVPRTPTPRTPGKQRPRLKDFCPNTQPMIPHLIIHCVLALERHFLESEGLYRIPGQESQIVKLLNEFRNVRFQPKLEYQDPETITGCIKRFLRQLRDSLIPSSSWDEFVVAASENDTEAIDRCVMDLPIPNRDTLAYLCSHFQKVCESSGRNKMTPEVLARSIAPTIVGRAPVRIMNFAQTSDEAMKQTRVMLTLLSMPRDYWPKFYSCETTPRPFGTQSTRTLTPSSRQQLAVEKTPHRYAGMTNHGDGKVSPSAADRSILGPIRTPPSDLKGKSVHSAHRRGNFALNPY